RQPPARHRASSGMQSMRNPIRDAARIASNTCPKRKPMLKKYLLATVAVGIAAAPAFAHVTLESSKAPVGTSYKAVLRVPHGCEGKPTNVVRVKLPQGYYAVKPMPKPGWSLEKVIGKYEKPYDN